LSHRATSATVGLLKEGELRKGPAEGTAADKRKEGWNLADGKKRVKTKDGQGGEESVKKG